MNENHTEGPRVSDFAPTNGGSETELRERLEFERAATRMLRSLVDCEVAAIDGWITESLALIGLITGADRTFATVSADAFSPEGESSHEWRRAGDAGPVRSRVSVRMMVRDEIVGSVGADAYDASRDWSPATHGMLEQFAGLVASALERRDSEASLRASEERFKRLVQNLPDVVLVIDPLANFLYASPQIESLLGYRPEELVGTSALDMIHPDETDEVALALVRTVEAAGNEAPEAVGLRARHRDGSWVPIEVAGSSALEDPSIAGIVVTVRDMRESLRIAATLEDVEIRWRQVFDHSPIGMATAAPDGRFLNVNPALCRMLGYETDELLTMTYGTLMHPDDAEASRGMLETIMQGRGADYTAERRYVRKDGSFMWGRVSVNPVRNADGTVLYLIGHVEDVTERKQFEERLSYEATHDALTGLPLRGLLLDHLELAVAGGRRHGTNVAVLFIDLDRFKRVNDSLGHAAGDELLGEVADRLRRAVRDVDTPGRFGGDEFVVVCPDLADIRDVVAIAERIRHLLEQPFEIRNVQIFVGASIGIAVADEHTDPEGLLRQADTAAYRAKERGRNRYEIFDDDLRTLVAQRLNIEAGLRHALDHDELRLYYQPIVAIERGEVVGFEALVRWQRGAELVAPEHFLAIAEETGLIVPLGRQVVEKACRQLASWDATTGVRVPHLAVNLSARQLTQPDLASDVRRALHASGIDPNRLCLEITETVLMQDTPQVIATINALRDLGVRLAIDDFGTGYSSLSYLRRLPVSAVKIDRSFILELGADHEGSTIVASVVSLAHALGMDIIAEGVETIEHVAALVNLGCDHAQGYFFSRPVDGASAADILRRGNVAHHPAA
jgi:diguanylate cyclase (GGDEF)-like protein/PAS domain S-box-containing protein